MSKVTIRHSLTNLASELSKGDELHNVTYRYDGLYTYM